MNFSEDPPLAINPALIKQYADQYASGDESGLRNLITLFNSQTKQKHRAEYLSQAYLNQITVLERKLKGENISAYKPLPNQNPNQNPKSTVSKQQSTTNKNSNKLSDEIEI